MRPRTSHRSSRPEVLEVVGHPLAKAPAAQSCGGRDRGCGQ
ncbi:hypothetical protein [Microbacterium karelineae]|nr:hypothetical protein [Microbacterium karelineae]